MIEQALLKVREDMARLTKAMRDKGHERATAYFQTERDLHMQISLYSGDIGRDGESAFVTEHGYRSHCTFVHGTNYAVMMREAEEKIERMELSVALACQKWFETEAA